MYDIYLYDQQVGRLVPRGDGVQFTYNARALADATMPGISLSMPKRATLYGGKVAKAFFLNLLPEGAYRRLVAEAAGTAAGNDSALLGAIGGECPGAIAIWPETQAPSDTPQYEALASADFTRLFDATNPMAIASATGRARLSLPGVQEKTALFRDDEGHWFRPINGAVTSHILKQAPAAYPELLENELFCMTLAAAAHLHVARVGLPMPGVRVFCAERFDRVRPTGADDARVRWRKLHQEDFCQVLAVLPARKYEDEGGPGLKACAGVVHDVSVLAIEDIPRLLRWVGFNYLVGNEDAHAKNLAVLYEPTGVRLAPHYDLLSTEVYAHLERKCAMKIGRSVDLRSVQASDWKRVAGILRLSWPAARDELRQLAGQVAAALAVARATCEATVGPAAVYDGVSALVQRRCAQLARELAR